MRIDRRINWNQVEQDLNEVGHAVIGPLLAEVQCEQMRNQYTRDSAFRKTAVMDQHGYGRGEYRYFQYPLPEIVSRMRTELYGPLAAIANRWNELVNCSSTFPLEHQEFLNRCHASGQTQATPLLLKYAVGDYNRLHQDLYGEHVFPLQVTVLLSKPGTDFAGGYFLLTEQRPRMQARAEVVELQQGEAVIFPVQQRPVQGRRGYHQVSMRHGVSRVRSGQRFTLGIIFHDAV
jgi:uncharacterized protein